mgnify:CR=1 FL=1
MERYYEAIDLLKGMISRPSFSRDETAVADFLQAEWQKAGQKVFRKGNNLWIIAPDFDFGKPSSPLPVGPKTRSLPKRPRMINYMDWAVTMPGRA